MPFNFYDTHTLLMAVQQLTPAATFLRDRYFPTNDGSFQRGLQRFGVRAGIVFVSALPGTEQQAVFLSLGKGSGVVNALFSQCVQRAVAQDEVIGLTAQKRLVSYRPERPMAPANSSGRRRRHVISRSRTLAGSRHNISAFRFSPSRRLLQPTSQIATTKTNAGQLQQRSYRIKPKPKLHS